ncbi:MAG: NAD(P)-dependent oxidoreductase [Acidimicrobiia bacterium]|nr:NAD(P)-dependent oxidoreductase [Acidimicrobiia bacterium]
MKLVVTGSQSFIGKALRRACRNQGIQWLGIDALPVQAIDEIQVDIRDPGLHRRLPAGADALVHLAAISREQDCRRDPAEAFSVNVGGTLNLIKAAQVTGVRQFVFASSEWVYGEVSSQGCQTEESVIDASRILSEYALSKLAGERLLEMAHRHGELAAAAVLRFGIVYGPRPGNWSAVEALFEAVRTREEVEVGALATARRFIHVDDIARGILAVLGRPGRDVFNLSGDRLVSLGEVIEESARILGRRPRVLEKNPRLVSVRNPDNAKARAELNWRPQMELVQGLESLCQVPACV